MGDLWKQYNDTTWWNHVEFGFPTESIVLFVQGIMWNFGKYIYFLSWRELNEKIDATTTKT